MVVTATAILILVLMVKVVGKYGSQDDSSALTWPFKDEGDARVDGNVDGHVDGARKC